MLKLLISSMKRLYSLLAIRCSSKLSWNGKIDDTHIQSGRKLHSHDQSTIMEKLCSQIFCRKMLLLSTKIRLSLFTFYIIHLTIIPRARMGYWLRGHEVERNNCFSKIQLVGQKYPDKTTLASKTRFSRHCFGFQSRRFSLLLGYNM